MSNESEGVMVAQNMGDDGRSSMVSSPRAQEQYIDIGVAEITPRQEAAIRALAAGMTYSEAAAAGGVDRATLFRWRTLDEDFKNALITMREQTHEQASDRFRNLAEASLRAVEGGLAKGDGRLGLSVLKALDRAYVRMLESQEQKTRQSGFPREPPLNQSQPSMCRISEMRSGSSHPGSSKTPDR